MRLLPVFSLPLLLSACGLFSRSGTNEVTPVLTQTEHFDPTTHSWVTTPSSAPQASASQQMNLREEKAPESATILSSKDPNALPPPPEGAEAASEEADQPGMLGRVGRAATAPLRWVGLGRDAE